ncbi:MAG: FAD-binding oxidoreductase, partial [Burkholderiales bacterium]|nr:FAD-binding oxidoreductase [Burkholderiales bacterium]
MNAITTTEIQRLQTDANELAARSAQVVHALRKVLPAHAVLSSSENTTPYECDGLTAYRQRPLCVALPET